MMRIYLIDVLISRNIFISRQSNVILNCLESFVANTVLLIYISFVYSVGPYDIISPSDRKCQQFMPLQLHYNSVSREAGQFFQKIFSVNIYLKFYLLLRIRVQGL